MTTSESSTKVVTAIGNVQQALQVLAKESEADAVKFKYKYSGMPAVWGALKPLLKKEGLTVVQSPTSGNSGSVGDYLVTCVYHTSGEWLKDEMRLVIPRDDPQGMGMAITYAERYSIKTIFKVVTDDDDAISSKLADGEMKKEWVREYMVVAKKSNPDATHTYNDFMKFMVEVYGKNPTQILAKEHQTVLDTIKAFDQ